VRGPVRVAVTGCAILLAAGCGSGTVSALDHTSATEADLRAAAATERRFDTLLLGIAFPAGTEPVIRLLHTVNQQRAQLTVTAAASTSLQQLHGYEQRLDTANEPVEQAVRAIRSQLGLPPPDTS